MVKQEADLLHGEAASSLLEMLPYNQESLLQRLSPVLEQEQLQFQIIGGSWLEVSRNSFDILEAEDGQPYRVFVFMLNMQNGRYLSRIWGKTISNGTLSTLSTLPPLITTAFHRRFPCVGVTNTDMVENLLVTEFPFRRAMAKDCTLSVQLPDEEYGVAEVHASNGIGKQCLSCLNMSVVKTEEVVAVVEDSSEIVKQEDEADPFDEVDLMDLDNIDLDEEEEEDVDLENIEDDDFMDDTKPIRRRASKKATLPRPSKVKEEDLVQCRHCDYKCSKRQRFKHEKFEHLRWRCHCDFCGKAVESVYQLLEHTTEAHPEREAIPCQICEEEVKVMDEFVAHYKECQKKSKVDRPKRSLQCKICSKSFRVRDQLTVHLRWHVGEKNLACEDCEFVTHSQFAMFSHKKRHKREKGNIDSLGFCQHCGKSFTSGFYLKQHIAYAHDKKFDNIKCEHCGLNFMKERQYRRHINKEHSTDPRFACDICGLRFGEIRSVKSHAVSHTDAPVVFCDICGKGLKKKGALRDHMRIHTGEKPFKCKECPYECKSSTALSLHMRFKHRGGVKASDMGPAACKGFVDELLPAALSQAMKEEGAYSMQQQYINQSDLEKTVKN